MSKHNERVYGDTTECHKCGKQWDTYDPEPPSCITGRELFLKQQRELKEINHANK